MSLFDRNYVSLCVEIDREKAERLCVLLQSEGIRYKMKTLYKNVMDLSDPGLPSKALPVGGRGRTQRTLEKSTVFVEKGKLTEAYRVKNRMDETE